MPAAPKSAPVALEDALFRPRGIAIVGASNDKDKLSGRPLDFLLRLGYRGNLVAVNPKRAEVQGVRAWPSLAEAPGPVDLAIVVVPSPHVAQALRDSAAAGATAAIVFASGFAEMGGRGSPMQDEIREIVRTTGIRIVGPNCLGTFALPAKAFATFTTAFDELSNLPEDPLAIVSQSGAVGTFMYSAMANNGLGARYFANTGNEVDVSVGELLGRLAEADDVDILIGYLEDARRLDHLAEAMARAERRGKPMLLLKSGATAEGRRSVGHHTAAQPGEDAQFQALVEQHGAIRVESLEAAGDLAMLLRQKRAAPGRRLALITSSGGVSSLTTDFAVQIGLSIDPPSPAAQAAIKPTLPEYGSVANPIDLTGSLMAEPQLLVRALDELVRDATVDMILVVLGNADRVADDLVKIIVEACGRCDKPFAVAWSGGSGRPRSALMAARIPTYPEPLRAVKAMKRLVDFSARAAQRKPAGGKA